MYLSLCFLTAAVLFTTLLVTNVTAQKQQIQRNDNGRNTIFVGQNDPNVDYTLLEEALAQAEAGDTLHLEGRFDLSGCPSDPVPTGLQITKNITISGMSDPNADPSSATQIHGCGPAFIVNNADEAEGALTIQNLWFRDQVALSIEFQNSVNPVTIRGNRFTDNIPLTAGANGLRFAVGAAAIGSFELRNLITVEDNHVDFSTYPQNDSFVGDDNGFAFAATDASLIIRNNNINTLGEGIEIEGNFGQDNTYLVEGNVVQTLVPPSLAGTSSGPPGSVAEAKEGGHPAAVKLHANEGTYIVRNNDITLTGLPNGVCMMATTLNSKALAGQELLFIENNRCDMDGQLAAILGAWGQTAPFFTAASLSGAVVSGNTISGSGTVGIGMISRTLVSEVVGSAVNTGHNNRFQNNDFSMFNATIADIGLDPQTYDNFVIGRPGDNIIDLGHNQLFDQFNLLPLIFGK